jgi:hypothetical protein
LLTFLNFLSMGEVNVIIGNGNLGGLIQTADGIGGIVMTGVSESGGYTLGTPILVTSMTDVKTAGITAANNPFAIKQLQEFYNQAGTPANLYVMLVVNTMTVALMASNSNANGCVKLLNYAGGRIKVLGLVSDDTVVTVGTITASINPDCYTAVTNMAVTAAAYSALETPFRCIIGATSYNGTASQLTNMGSGTTNNYTGLLLGDTVSGKGACVGLLLGVVSSIPVQRKISRVATGALTATNPYVGTVTALATGAGTMNNIAANGFITFTMYAQTSGWFFSEDVMCTASTDDYYFLARGRVIDKAHILTYVTYVQSVMMKYPSIRTAAAR